MKILIVGDDPNLRALFSEALHRAGHLTVAAADAAGGIAALASGGCDVLVLDLRLVRDHGADVLREVGRRGLAVRIVVLTGAAEIGRDEVFAMSPAISAVLRKPVDVERLVAEVERAGKG